MNKFNLKWSYWFSMVLILGILTSCAYSNVEKRPVDLSELKFSSNDNIFVMNAKDGSYGSIDYPGSGKQLSSKVLEIVRKKFPLAQSIEETNEINALKNCRVLEVNYLISPVILHWEDRLTSWSGYRDKIKVELRLIQTEPRKLIASTKFESRNNSMTFLNTHPQDLLDKDFEKAVFALFQP